MLLPLYIWLFLLYWENARYNFFSWENMKLIGKILSRECGYRPNTYTYQGCPYFKEIACLGVQCKNNFGINPIIQRVIFLQQFLWLLRSKGWLCPDLVYSSLKPSQTSQQNILLKYFFFNVSSIDINILTRRTSLFYTYRVVKQLLTTQDKQLLSRKK